MDKHIKDIPKDVRKMILSKLAPKDYISAIESSSIWPKDDEQYKDKKDEYIIDQLNEQIRIKRESMSDIDIAIYEMLHGETTSSDTAKNHLSDIEKIERQLEKLKNKKYQI